MIITTKDTPPHEHLKFIREYIRDYSRLPKHLYSHSLLNYYTKQLRQAGVIVKRGYGVWETTKDTPPTTTKTHHVDKNIRGHGYHIKLKIPKLRNWNRREEYLKKRGIRFVKIPQGHRILVRKHKVWLCGKCIIIYYPKGLSFYANSAKEAHGMAITHLESLIITMENKLKCSLRIKGKYLFKVSKNHYAKVRDDLAREMNDKQQKVYCYIDGRQWCVIDYSLAKDETETLKPDSALKDMDHVLNPFLTDLKRYYDKTGETILLSDIIKGFGMYAENIKSHIESIQILGRSVKELTKVVKELRK